MSRSRPLVALVAVLAVAVLAGSIATIAVRTGRSHSSGHAATPTQVSTAYYEDLHEQNASAAFALLCPAQQAQGEGAFAQTLGLDGSSGTGISSFVVTGDATITGTDASVPGSVKLDNGQALPIHVLLTDGGSGWQVCSSDLGGVLPAPGSATGSPSASV